ncbi:hypothetical protein ABTX77_22765 [Streptomyces sp. NPDC097704]|uniref:hypothetical protein n=1 Tax=Streptomyces sp. NPDC097704 TaxID=3157101 RepID=UPI00332D1C9F
MLLTRTFDAGVLVVRLAPVTAPPTAADPLSSNTSGSVRVYPSVARALSDVRSQPAAPTGTGPRP